jgi:hypothetical protein
MDKSHCKYYGTVGFTTGNILIPLQNLEKGIYQVVIEQNGRDFLNSFIKIKRVKEP